MVAEVESNIQPNNTSSAEREIWDYDPVSIGCSFVGGLVVLAPMHLELGQVDSSGQWFNITFQVTPRPVHLLDAFQHQG